MTSYAKQKRIRKMKKQSIYTENDNYKSAYDEWEKLAPSLTRSSSIPVPQSFKPYNVAVEHSGAFNDFNQNVKKKRGFNHNNKFRLLNYMGGNNAKGLYKHDSEDYFSKDETVKIKYKMRKPKTLKINRDELAKQEQRTTEGAEIAGLETSLNINKAKAEVKFVEKTKSNRGGWNAGKDSGAFQGGFSYTGYNASQIKRDSVFKQLNSQQTEFRSIIEGEIMNSGGNANIVQQPE